MWCKEEKSGNPFSESHFSPGQTGEIHDPAEHQNNYTRQEQPDPLHAHTIGSFLYFPQDYHRGKSACHSEANSKLGLVDHFPSRREVGRVSNPAILRFPGGCDLRAPGDRYGVTAYGGTGTSFAGYSLQDTPIVGAR